VTGSVPPAGPAPSPSPAGRLVVDLDLVGAGDVAEVGGKGANLGELRRAGFRVPPGFVVTSSAYLAALTGAGLRERVLADFRSLVEIDEPEDRRAPAAALRQLVAALPVPGELRSAVAVALDRLGPDTAVAVRSSATAEDAAGSSFAGAHATVLGVVGVSEVVEAISTCWASVFTDRAVAYRLDRHELGEPLVAVVVQELVPAEAAGVAFSEHPGGLDPDLVVVESARGLGESVVSGAVEPDHDEVDARTWSVRRHHAGRQTQTLSLSGGRVERTGQGDPLERPVLDEPTVVRVARTVRAVAEHFGRPQDVEWAVVGGELFVLQSRPITTLPGSTGATRNGSGTLPPRDRPAGTLVGLGASAGLATGPVRIVADPRHPAGFARGDVLVAHRTSPDWVPLLRRAAAVVTESGGTTCHAAIVSRELGVPCVVGVHDATTLLSDGDTVRVDGTVGTVEIGTVEIGGVPPAVAREDGPAPVVFEVVPAGPATSRAVSVLGDRSVPAAVTSVTATRIEVNLAVVDGAAAAAALPVDGVGLLRAEVLLVDALDGVHPAALVASGGADRFVDRLAEAVAAVAAPFGRRPVRYRSTDLRSNEFRRLEGGEHHEPREENPMIGYRGCARYVADPTMFRLELEALARVREHHPGVQLMIPFVRTPWELERCMALVDESPLGADRGLQRWIMAEVPSVAHRLADYAALGVDGVSIGTNDLTQLVLGVDRDSGVCAELFDPADAAVLATISEIVERARAAGLATSLCGQAPSDDPAFAEHLVRAGIDAISVTPDAVGALVRAVSAAEQRLVLEGVRSGTVAGGPRSEVRSG